MQKKIISVLLIVLGIFPNVYGQKFSKKTLKELGGASRTVQVPSTISETILRRAAVARQSVTPALSFNQQRRVALQMRPLLFRSSRWTIPLKQGIFHKDVEANVESFGNLTELSPQQWKQVLTQYQQAMKAVQTLSSYIDKHIYYLATPEAEQVSTQQIAQILAEITRAQGLVQKATISLGDNQVLKEATLYLNNAQGFYMMLSTGAYFEVNSETEQPILRHDGHTYNCKEFALAGNCPVWEKIFSILLPKLSTWFSRSGKLPKRLRVAVLQDDKRVISDIEKMHKRENLTQWEIDYYKDPEYFLSQVPYGQYDLILTDVLMKNGGGRYLTRQLRARGYEGSIITISGFDAEQGGQAFFTDGVDGMIDVYENRVSRPDWLWTRLNHYFWLKQKYGWKH